MARILLILLLSTGCSAQVYMGSVTDPYAATRVAPGSIGTLPVMPTAVLGNRNVILNQDLYAGFIASHTLTNGTMLVDTVNGSDSTCTVNTLKACKTIFEAVRQKVDSFVYVKCPAGGTYVAANSTEYDYRFTDPGYGNGVKYVSFDKECHVTFPGDNIGTNTWTATGGHTGVYQTTIACYSASCGWVSAVQRNDQNDGSGFVDAWGTAFNDRLYTTFPNLCASGTYTTGQYTYVGAYVLYQATGTVSTCPPGASWTLIATGASSWPDSVGLANLDLLSEGWWFSNSTGVLYVKLGGLDLTQPTNAAKLSARYYAQGQGPGGNVPRVLLLGTTIFYQNAFFDGIQFQVLQYNNSGTYVNSSAWCEWCTIFDALGYGMQLDGGAWNYVQNIVIHANASDGMNADLGADGVTQSNMERISIRSTWAGDPHTYLSGVLPGTQPVNNGESSHCGYSVDLGGFYSQNYGPECADTSRASCPSQSWFVGTYCGQVNALNTSNIGGVVMLGVSIASPNNRQFWLDTVIANHETSGSIPQSIYVDTTAVCKLYNTTYDAPIAYVGGAANCNSFTPNAP